MKKILKKYPVIRYILGSYMKVFIYSLILFTAAFAVLQFTGLYTQIENAVNLKYNSPFVLVPLYGFAVLSVLCLVIGFLMYFYKYKRTKRKSEFYKTFSGILNEKQMSKD